MKWHESIITPSTSEDILLHIDNSIEVGHYSFGKYYVYNNGDYGYGGCGQDYKTTDDPSESTPYRTPKRWAYVREALGE